MAQYLVAHRRGGLLRPLLLEGVGAFLQNLDLALMLRYALPERVALVVVQQVLLPVHRVEAGLCLARKVLDGMVVGRGVFGPLLLPLVVIGGDLDDRTVLGLAGVGGNIGFLQIKDGYGLHG